MSTHYFDEPSRLAGAVWRAKAEMGGTRCVLHTAVEWRVLEARLEAAREAEAAYWRDRCPASD